MIKQKNIFDTLNNVSNYKDKDYFKNLNESEQKDFNIFMLQRYISMEKKYISFISFIDKYAFNCLDKEMYHKLLVVSLPKEKKFFNYLKKNKEKKKEELLIEMLAKKFKVSKTEATDYLIFLSVDDKKKLLEGFSLDDKVIKKCIDIKK